MLISQLMWLPIAIRNLSRNRRRTLLTLAVIALGTAMSFSVSGYIDDALRQLRQGAVDQYGNLQIASPLLWKDKTQGAETLIQADTMEQIAKILSQQNAVSAFSPQLVFSGLASTQDKSKVLRVISFALDNPALDYNDLVVEGNQLEAEARNPVLIGGSLAKELDLDLGAFFRVTTNTVGGAYNMGTLQVAGIFSRNDIQDESQLIFVPMQTGKTLLNTAGISKVAITLTDLRETGNAAVGIQQALDNAGLNLEVRTWEQLSTYYRQVRGFFDMLLGFLMLSITLLVFFIVFQVLTMSFFERTHEVGTVRALGTQRSQVFVMLLIEGLLLGILGGGLGLAIGWGLGQAFNAMSFEWVPPGALYAVPIELSLSWDTAWLPLVISVIATFFSALFPTTRTARLRVIEALRTT